MIKFEVEKDGIDYCSIPYHEIDNAKFEDGLAIVRVRVTPNEGEEYDTLTIVEEIKDEASVLVGYGLDYSSGVLSLSGDVESIKRFGKHFIVEKTVWNYDKTRSWKEFLQVDYIIQDDEILLTKRAKLPGIPTFVNDEVLIITSIGKDKSCLYSLEMADIQSPEFSSIESVDGETFLVTDTVKIEEDQNIKDRFSFKMDKHGRRISDVYQRSINGFLADELDFPYILIRERRINELKEDYRKEKNTEKYLRRN